MATQDQIAAHLDLGVRHVRRLLAAGVLPASKGRGGLNTDRCRVAYIAHLRGVAAGHQSKDGSLDLTEERAKLAKEQTETAAIRNAESRGELLPASEVLEYWAKQVVAVKAHLRGIPARFASQVPQLTPGEIGGLRDLIHETLTNLADGVPPTAAVGPGKATDILDLAE